MDRRALTDWLTEAESAEQPNQRLARIYVDADADVVRSAHGFLTDALTVERWNIDLEAEPDGIAAQARMFDAMAYMGQRLTVSSDALLLKARCALIAMQQSGGQHGPAEEFAEAVLTEIVTGRE